MKLAHIVNPVCVPVGSDLFRAQPVTFETMRLAKAFSHPRVEVSLFSAQFEEDLDCVPQWFTKTPSLERSILDEIQVASGKRLPLIGDILERLYEASAADYFMYTNVDIALMPYFYDAIADLISAGYDGLVVNRRTVQVSDNHIEQLGLLYAEIGESHQGHDCFVFRREAFPKYMLGSTCIGADGIGRLLLCNVACHARCFKEVKDSHLTFHLGDDRVWRTNEHSHYNDHNQQEILGALATMESLFGPFEKDSPLRRYIQEYRAYRLSMTTEEHEGQRLVPGYRRSSKSRLIGRLRQSVSGIVRRGKNDD